MTDSKKPEGPIWIDNSSWLFNLPVWKLVLVANLALNQLNVRQIGEIQYHAGFDLKFEIKDKANDHTSAAPT